MFSTQFKYFFVLFFSLSSTPYAQNSQPANNTATFDYQIVVDAGSTGTRLHIFKIETSNTKKNLPNIEEIYFSQISTGIASHINSQREINEHLSAIFNPTQRYCFQTKIPCSSAPVHFLATGGARILKPSQQKTLFNYVQTWLEDYSMFQNIAEIRVLTGKEEAELGWLTSFENEIKHNQPFGAYFELGGASLQYAYFLDDPKQANTHFHIGNKDIYLKTGSWLGFGLNEATNRVIDYWHVSHAVCFPKGSNKTSSFNYSRCFSLFQNYLNVNENFTSHKVLIEKLVEKNAPIKLGAAFDYLIPSGFKVNEPGKFHDKLKSVCAMPWRQIRSDYIDLVSIHQADICAHGTYVLTLFSVLDLPKSYSNYIFNNLSWSRGVIIKSWLQK
ncbi:MAG: hypothetical protein VX835_05025 [Pseudomonadota bacterium]|nr:hypothetical protein [Pseudomonadota bacterium]